jgi:hypothetical protein
MELIHKYTETPSNSCDPPSIMSKCVLVTPDVEFTIPTHACIYYENKLFTLESLEHDESGKCISGKFKKTRDYFDKRVNKTSLEISICDARKALLDFKFKNNFTVIYGNRPCCCGFKITKLGFDFLNDTVTIEQECCWSCDNYVDTMDVHTYTIEDNSETLLLMLSTALQYMKNRRSESCTRAADIGNLEWLKYAHEKGYLWNEFTCSNTAYQGNVDCLKYLHENGCPWNATTCDNAARKGNFECLKYAIENGCPYGDEITLHAAEIRSVKCLKYLHEHGCKFHEMTTFAAAKYGNLECLKYAVENGAPKHPETCRTARGSGYGGIACYNYAIANGFPE